MNQNIIVDEEITPITVERIGVFIPIAFNKVVMEYEVLGAFSTEKLAIEKLVSVVPVAHRADFNLCIERYELDGRYIDTIYPFSYEEVEE